ncbi:lipopolysaccharide biosynthesis protein [Sphingomonas phyllosphaerae]|uniref:lipopolysaccharide biosynthesis protein n=1 Tax=Sphingomonas phyllosphaerae TaxID=257003 RepID=UPI00138B0A7F|nr:oligosaccharide flippase family protein [Sphingomonas phyllosphaerae]
MARPAVLNTLSLAISSGLNFISLLLWVRLLPPVEFGQFTLITTTALLINAILFEWARIVSARTLYSPTAATRIDPARADALFTIVFGLILLLGILTAVLSISGHTIFGLGPRWMWVLFVFLVSEVALTQLNVISRARHAAWHTFWVIVTRSALSLVIGLALVLGYGLGLSGVLLGLVIGQAVAVIGGIATDAVWRRLRIAGARAEDREVMGGMLKLGAPLMLSSGLSYGVGVLDRYQVEHILGTSSVAYYAAPSDLLQKTLGFAMLAVNITMYPAMVRAYEDEGPDKARVLLEGNAVMYVAMCLPVLVAATVLAGPVSHLLLGARLAPQSAPLLPLVTAAALLRLLTIYHLQVAFQLTRHMRLLMIAPALAIATFVALGPLALHRYGLIGIAGVSLLAQAGGYTVSAVMARRTFGIRLLGRDNAKVLVAGAAMAAALLPFAHVTGVPMTLVALAAGGLVYAAAILLLRLDQVRTIKAKFVRR